MFVIAGQTDAIICVTYPMRAVLELHSFSGTMIVNICILKGSRSKN